LQEEYMKRIYWAPALLAFLSTAAAFAEVENLSIFRIPGAIGLTDIIGITNSGVVYGSVSTAPYQRKGFFLKNGTFSFWEYPNETVTQIFGANDAGDFIGTAFSYINNTFTPVLPFVVRSGAITVLTPPANYTSLFLTGINNRGVIVGHYFDGTYEH